MKMRKPKGGGGSNWMDTYGDMVTLLLCFFVLLYSMSVIDEDKWLALVRSFNPDAVDNPAVFVGDNGASSDQEDKGMMEALAENQAKVDEALEKLYQELKEYAEASDSGKNIETVKGDGYVFISFDDAVFFAGNSYQLLPAGEKILGDVAGMFSQAAPYIDEIRIMGHTAQARPGEPNIPREDRFLSSNRATIATIYIQEHSSVEPARIVSFGYGQHRPIDSNETEAGRSHNRRVEIVITGQDLTNAMGDSVTRYYNKRDGGNG